MTAVWPVEPGVAYQLVSDVVGSAAHSAEVVAVQWDPGADPGRPRVGDRFTARNSAMGRSWTSTATVIDADPGTRFAFVVGPPDRPTAVWSFDLEPAPDAEVAGQGTRVTYTVVLGPGPSMLDHARDLGPERYAVVVAGRLDHLQHAMSSMLTAMGPRA